MNIIWAIVLLAGGLIVLWKSADLLVAGAVALAQHLGARGGELGAAALFPAALGHHQVLPRRLVHLPDDAPSVPV